MALTRVKVLNYHDPQHSVIFFLLLMYVGPDDLLVPTYRRSEVASCPEVLSCKVPNAACKCPGNVNCALALDVTYDLSYRDIGADAPCAPASSR